MTEALSMHIKENNVNKTGNITAKYIWGILPLYNKGNFSNGCDDSNLDHQKCVTTKCGYKIGILNNFFFNSPALINDSSKCHILWLNESSSLHRSIIGI